MQVKKKYFITFVVFVLVFGIAGLLETAKSKADTKPETKQNLTQEKATTMPERFVQHSSLGSLKLDSKENVDLNLVMDKDTKCYYIITKKPFSISPYIVDQKPYCEKDNFGG